MKKVFNWRPFRASSGEIYFVCTQCYITENANIIEENEAKLSVHWNLPREILELLNNTEQKNKIVETNSLYQQNTLVTVLQVKDSNVESTEFTTHRIYGDGIIAANDESSWECYQTSDIPPKRYFYNLITQEKTWRIPPGCQEKQPINIPESWLTFVSKDHADKRYYFNKISKELTWYRPFCLGKPLESEQGHDITEIEEDYVYDKCESTKSSDFVFKSQSGDTSLLPDNYDQRIDNSIEKDAIHKENLVEEFILNETNTPSNLDNTSNIQDTLTNEDTEKLKENDHTQTILKAQFESLLDEYGVQHYSAWSNWFPKLSKEQRFLDAPIEYRAQWFKEYTVSLIGHFRQTRIRRLKSFISILEDLKKKDLTLFTAIQHFSKKDNFIEYFSNLQAQENGEIKLFLWKALKVISILSPKDYLLAISLINSI